MSLVDSIYVSIFGMAVVFIVLIGLSFLIGIQSFKKMLTPKETPRNNTEKTSDAVEYFTPELKLINVDDKTAAMVMAIVSDEIGIPPNELNFKYIKAVNDDENGGDKKWNTL